MRSIIGLQRPVAGEISVFGESIVGKADGDALDVRRRWGVLFQHGALFSALNVFDNIALPLRELNSVPDSLVKPLVMLKLAQVGLKPADAFKCPAEL
ncbi:ABC transporter ATP-binding protein, partial [Acinetobacter baumannii]